MSRTIDQRVVEMKFDNSQFERNVSTTMSTLSKLKQSLNFSGASKGLEDLNSATRNFNMSGMSNAIESVGLSFSGLQVMAVTALTRITNAAMDAGKKIVMALTIDPIKMGFQEYETQINAVQTILANTSHNGTTLDEVNVALDTLNKYADKTIYNFTEMTRNIGTFTAAGVDLNTSVSAIQGIANLAAISGSTSHQASTAMYQLSQALAAGRVSLMDWNSVVNAGMGGKVFQDALVRTSELLGTGAQSAIDMYGSFRESLTQGQWLTTEVLTETLKQFAGAYSEADLIAQGFTEEQAKAIYEMSITAENAATKVKTFTQLWDTLKEAAQSGWTQTWEILIGDFEEAKELLTSVSDYLNGVIGKASDARNELLQGWKDAGGRTTLLEAFKNIFEGLLSVIEPIGEAFKEMFPAVTVDQLLAFTDGFKKLTESFKLGETASNNLKQTFKGIFAIFKVLGQAIGAVVKAFAPLFGYVVDLGGGILGVTGAIGSWLVKLSEAIEKSDIFNTVMQAIAGFVYKIASGIKNAVVAIKDWVTGVASAVKNSNAFSSTLQGISGFAKAAASAIKTFISAIKEKIVAPGLELLESILKRVGERISHVTDIAGEMKAKISEAMDGAGSAFKNNAMTQNAQAFMESLKGIGEGIINVLGSLMDSIIDKISNADFSGLFDLINTGAFAGIAIAIGKFLKTVSNPIEGFTGLFDGLKDILTGVTGILDSVRGCFEAYQQKLKADILQKIAIAIGILAASIVAISLIDSDKLTASLGAISMLFIDLMTAMAVFGKVDTNVVGVGKTITAMIAVSTAVLILASALKKLSELEIGEMMTGLVGVAGLTAIVAGFAKVMSKNGPVILKGATQMVIFGVAIKILASVCKDLAQLNFEQLAGGLIGVGVLMGEVALFLNNTNFSGKSISSAIGMVAIAGAMKILASACADFGQMKWEELGKGLAGVSGLLLAIAGFTKLTGNAQSILSTSVALVIIAGAMKVFGSAVKDIGQMSWEELGKGLAAMAGGLTVVALATKLMPKNILTIGASLIVISGALVVLSEALTRMSIMTWEEIGKSLVILAGSMTILAVALRTMTTTLPGSAALLVASAALAVLTPILVTLGNMSWGSIVKGLVAVAGALAIIGVAGAVLGPLAPAILALSGALAVMGVGLLAISASLLVAGMGLTALAAGFTALISIGAAGAAAIVSAMQIIITGTASLIPMLAKQFGLGILAICQVIAEGAPAIGAAVKAIVLSLVDVLVECVPAIAEGALALVVGVLGALAGYAPQIVDYIFQFLIGVLESLAKNIPDLIQATVNVFASYFSGVIDALKSMDTTTLVNGIAAIGLISAFMVALAAIAVLTPAAMIGVVGMGAVIAELSIVLAAIGALAQIPGLEWLISEGGQFLQTVGSAIGGFVGSIVGGFASGVSSHFAQIGSDLSDFMNNVQPFIEGAKNIDESVSKGVQALAGAILAITAANVVDGLTSWLTGGSSLADFGKELAEFAPHFKTYADDVAGIDGETVVASANAALALAEMARKLPNSGGVAGWFAGENSLSAFAEELAEFGPKLKEYADSVAGLDAGVVTNSTNAALAIAEMANKLPNQGGVAGWFAGENSLSVFAAELAEFGPKLKEYADSVAGLDAGVVTNSTAAALALAEMASKLPNSGGVASWFAGDNTLSKFGDELASFGPKFATFAESVSGVAVDSISSVISQIEQLGDMFNNMANIDTSGVSGFMDALSELGSVSVDSFAESIGNSAPKITSAVSGMMNTLVKSVNSKKNTVTNAFTNVIQASLSKIRSNNAVFKTAGSQLVTQFVGGIKTSNTSISSIFSEMISKALSGIKRQESSFRSAGAALTAKLIDGIRSKTSGLSGMFSSALSGMVSSIRSHYSSFYSAGAYLVAGFAKGISANAYLAENAASAMAGAARAAASKELQINSPSKVGYVIGGFFTEGVANGISGNTRLSENASVKMANKTIDATEEAFDKGKFATNIGKMISDGLAKGILNNSGKAVQASKKAFENSVNWINKNKEANELSLIEELSAWKRVQSSYAEGTDERKKASEEIMRTQKELADANEAYYNDVLKVQEESNEKRKQLDEEYYNNANAIKDKLSQDIQDLEDEYTNAFTSRRDALYNSYKLFEEVDPSEYVGGDTLISNLQSQVNAIDEWSTQFNQLSSKISESGLVEELRELGVSSASQIKALNRMTEAELNKYVALWKEKHTLAASQAREELQEMDNSITNKIYEMKDQADVELESYKNAWVDSIQKLNDESQAKLDELKTTWMQKVVGLKVDTTSEFTKMSNEITNILGQSSKWSNAGANIIEGVLSGVVNSSASLYTEVENVMATALSTAKEALDINSPSKEFEKIGMYSDEGFVNGLRKYAYRVADSAEYVGRNALDILRSSISRIASAVEDGIDTQPTIRPVLDLSNVESGAAKLNTMFSRTQAMSISTGMRRGVKEELPNESADSKVGSTYNFTQNNYSPKSLSRSEIYRQTKNQFSAFERMVKA